MPESAAIPPTNPPTNDVTISSQIQLSGNGNNCTTRPARMFSFGMLLSKANAAHTTNKAAKPEQNACNDVLPIKNATKKAIMAATHHGEKKPQTKDKISMIKNNISSKPL